LSFDRRLELAVESSDESMPEETASQRLSRYQNRDQCEVSETDEWAVIHYGLAGDERDETELTKENGILRVNTGRFQMAPPECCHGVRDKSLTCGFSAKTFAQNPNRSTSTG
jgi:hypothetical protein